MCVVTQPMARIRASRLCIVLEHFDYGMQAEHDKALADLAEQVAAAEARALTASAEHELCFEQLSEAKKLIDIQTVTLPASFACLTTDGIRGRLNR